MNAKDLIKEGKLSEVRAVLVEAVKTAPTDIAKRTLLFQVMLYLGEWDKAEKQLDILGLHDKELFTTIDHYKKLVQAERERVKVIRGEEIPSFLPKTPEYFPLYAQAVQTFRDGEIDKSEGNFQKLNEIIPEITGSVNGEEFSGLRNTDTLLGCFLETFAHERYVWVPFESIRELIITPPKNFQDLLWLEATLTTWEGLTMNCVLPTVYPESFYEEENTLKLGRMTDWKNMGGSFYKGLGQQVFEFGDREMAILEIQEIQFKYTGVDEEDADNN